MVKTGKTCLIENNFEALVLLQNSVTGIDIQI